MNLRLKKIFLSDKMSDKASSLKSVRPALVLRSFFVCLISERELKKRGVMQENKNILGKSRISVLVWKLGLPMIVSMVLQAVYNIVDTVFVVNMGEGGIEGNLALTYAFPVQILIIAVGVGTGVGINVLLSRSLGEGETEKAGKIAGNGIFLGFCIYAVFLIFGIFGAEWFISLQANGNEAVTQAGKSYLQICSCCSFGAVGYTIYERFLQSTGKTGCSMISQISGALTNVLLDWVFIYPCNMGISGAAWATVIGQVVSLITAMAFHYANNKEIKNGLRFIKPSWGIIKSIYSVGITAAVMQALLSVMMFAFTMILSVAGELADILQGAFGIYYKIQQIALFAAFGMSNAIMSVTAFNFGMGDKKRVFDTAVWGIADTVIVCAVITALFQIFAHPLAKVFGMTGTDASVQLQQACVTAMRIATIGYVFMGASVAVQGVLQGLGYSVMPLILSVMRLVVFVLPPAYIFAVSADPTKVWWSMPVAEALTAVFAFVFVIVAKKRKINKIVPEMSINENIGSEKFSSEI